MNRKITKKIAAFLLSGTLLAAGTAGILPGIRQTGLLDSVSLTAEAKEWEGSSYTKTYMNIIYTFKVKEDKDKGIYEAQITGFRPNSSSYPVDVWIPSTVTCNGKSYRVTEVEGWSTQSGSQVAGKVTRIYIPYTVKSIGQSSFSAFTSLSSVRFVDSNNFATDSVSACGIKYAAYNSFSATCPFIKNQMNKNGFAVVGNCLLKLSASNPTTLDLSGTKYNSVKYIARNTLSEFKNLKTLYLPRNLQGTSEYVCPASLTTVYYWNSGNCNLLSDVQNGKKSTALNNIAKNCGGIYQDTALEKQLSTALVKKVLQKKKLTYRGSVYSGYDAWTQYKIVHALYQYIGKNYYHYNPNLGQSAGYVSEMIQTEIGGYKGENQTAGFKCEEYAKMFEALCIAAGVDAKYVADTPGKHAWNVVKIGGEWFNADTCLTWLGQTYTFMTSHDIITKNCGCHNKDAKYASYVCRRAMGDVNQNGSVDIADAQLIKNWLAGKTNLTKFQQVLCDVDRSGTVDVRDANLISDYYNEALIGYSYNSFEQFYQNKIGLFNQFKP